MKANRFALCPALLALCAHMSAVESPDAAPSFGDTGHKTTRIGGYAELHYNNFNDPDKSAEIDLHRFVLMFEHEISPTATFIGELEVEHSLAGDGKPGEVEVEQAYIDFKLNDDHSVWGGLFLIPVSNLNMNHEPENFHGVERPYIEKVIIPTTWWEGGAGAHGQLSETVTYWAAITSAFDHTGFKAKDGFRGGRQKVAEAGAEGLMATGRIEWRPTPSNWLGATVIGGESNQDRSENSIDSSFTLIVVEGAYQAGGLELSGTFAQGTIDNADQVGANNGQTIAESFNGYYVTLGYNLLQLKNSGSKHYLAPFIRYENFDNQASMPSGVTANQAYQGDIVQVGITWKPEPQIAIKFDYQDWSNEANTAIDQWNLGIGWSF